MDGYCSQDIEKYMLSCYTPEKGTHMDKELLTLGHKTCLFAIVVLVIANILTLMDGRYSLLFANAIILVLLPVIIVASIKYTHYEIKESIKENHVKKRENPYMKVLGIIGASTGLLLARAFFTRASDTGTVIMINIIIVLLFSLLTFIACHYYYRVYLIRKYCPHINK